MRKLITIALPAFNEEGNLPRLEERLGTALISCMDRYDFEFLILDNRSTDRTYQIAQEICRRDARYRLVRYSRNFGCEASLCAALDLARGDAVVLLFSDLQDPPELIPTFIKHWEEGADVVYGQLNQRSDSNFLKTTLAPVAYWLIRVLSDCNLPLNATDFRLIDRRTVNILKGFRETDRYLRGLVHWVGFKQVSVAYHRKPRTGGKSSANLLYCTRFALHAVVCFSGRPLELAMWVGLVLTMGSFVLSIIYIALFFARPFFMQPPPPGITTLILFQTFSIGMNSLFLGVIGNYLARVYNQGKNRPLYIIDQDSKAVL